MLDWSPQGPPLFYPLNLPWKDALPIGWNSQGFGAIQVVNQRPHVSIIPHIAPAPSLKECHCINPRIISNIVSSRFQPFEKRGNLVAKLGRVVPQGDETTEEQGGGPIVPGTTPSL